MKNFAGINFGESPILKNFAGINFRESTFSGVKKGIYFRDFGQNSRNSRNFLPAKISSLKLYNSIIVTSRALGLWVNLFNECSLYELRHVKATLRAETFAGRNFRESPKSRNFANLSFANFILWRKFTEKTFAILWKSSFLDGNNFREWLGKVNNNHFKSHFNFFP